MASSDSWSYITRDNDRNSTEQSNLSKNDIDQLSRTTCWNTCLRHAQACFTIFYECELVTPPFPLMSSIEADYSHLWN